MESSDTALERMMGVLERSVSFDRDRWLALNASVNALMDGHDVSAYVLAQQKFRIATARPFETGTVLFDEYPAEPLGGDARMTLRSAVLEARKRYHERNAPDGEQYVDLYGLLRE